MIFIDPSLSSTAAVKEQDNQFYLYTTDYYTSTGSVKGKYKELSHYINVTPLDRAKTLLDIAYNAQIIADDFAGESAVIEGFSYSSKSSSFIQIVQFGTMLRYHIKDYEDVPPSQLKKKTCELVYGGKRNENGKAGGSFNKDDMYQALKDYKPDHFLLNFKQIWVNDLIDAYFLKQTNKIKQ